MNRSDLVLFGLAVKEKGLVLLNGIREKYGGE